MSNFIELSHGVFLDLDKVICFEEVNVDREGRTTQDGPTHEYGASKVNEHIANFYEPCVLVFFSGNFSPFVFKGEDNLLLRARLDEWRGK